MKKKDNIKRDLLKETYLFDPIPNITKSVVVSVT